MNFLIDLLLAPWLVVGTCLGIGAALLVHSLLPELSPSFGGFLVVAGFLGGLFLPWLNNDHNRS